MKVLLSGLLAVVVLSLLVLGCGSMTSSAMPNPITEPVVDQPGRNMVRYRDIVIEVVVESNFAAIILRKSG